tara:strand:+ start:5459 stop:6790 length:1332 start_codon:yes stop_codon:yes gene_type:complete
MKIKQIVKLIGLDQDIIWTIYNKLWSGIKGSLIVVFVIKFLLPNEQGLWYTFISLGALKIFAELGFTSVITQFVSHEFANISKENITVDSKERAKSRFFSLIKYSIRLYSYVVPIAIIIMIIIGGVYFRSNESRVFYAWIFFSIAGGCSLLLSLFQAIYKGLDKVKAIEKNLLLGSLLMGLGNCLFLFLDFKIWSLVISNILGLFIMAFSLFKLDSEFWFEVINYKEKNKIYWGKEILNLQFRYAISWISGYFIFSLIVPFLYKYEDPIIAGQYGITFVVISSVVGLAQAWIITKIPKFGILVANKEKVRLNHLFKKSFVQGISIQICFSILLMLGFVVLEYLNIFEERFLSLKLISLLLLIQIPVQIINMLAIYLRAHKEEPYVILSLISALVIVLGLFLVLKNYNLYFFLVYTAAAYYFFLLSYALIVFYKKKKLYKIKYL